MEWIFQLDEIGRVAKEFWLALPGKRVLAFYGEMGAGKTTFIHALCDQRGVKDVVGSPSFSLINEYATSDDPPQLIYHMDLYRVNSEDEAVRAGVEDCLLSDHTCLIEWPEKIKGLLPDETVNIHIELIYNNRRRLKIGDI